LTDPARADSKIPGGGSGRFTGGQGLCDTAKAKRKIRQPVGTIDARGGRFRVKKNARRSKSLLESPIKKRIRFTVQQLADLRFQAAI